MYGHFFFYLSIIASATIPGVLLDAVKSINDGEKTLIHKIVLGVCSGIIMWTLLMMLREGLNLF